MQNTSQHCGLSVNIINAFFIMRLPFLMYCVYCLLLYLHLSLLAAPFTLFLSGKAQGAIVEAVVDGDGHRSSRNSGLRLTYLPPLSYHHLLQSYQEVRSHPNMFNSVCLTL